MRELPKARAAQLSKTWRAQRAFEGLPRLPLSNATPDRILLARFSRGGVIVLVAGLHHRERLGGIIAPSTAKHPGADAFRGSMVINFEFFPDYKTELLPFLSEDEKNNIWSMYRLVWNSDRASSFECVRRLKEISSRSRAAMYILCCVYEEDESSNGFYERRIGCLRKLSRLGYAPAIFYLGYHYSLGDIVSRRKKLGDRLIRKAADQGHPVAEWLDGCRRIGEGDNFGYELISRAASSGVADAITFMKNNKI